MWETTDRGLCRAGSERSFSQGVIRGGDTRALWLAGNHNPSIKAVIIHWEDTRGPQCHQCHWDGAHRDSRAAQGLPRHPAPLLPTQSSCFPFIWHRNQGQGQSPRWQLLCAQRGSRQELSPAPGRGFGDAHPAPSSGIVSPEQGREFFTKVYQEPPSSR